MDANKIIRLLTKIDVATSEYFCAFLILSGDGQKLIPYFLDQTKLKSNKRIYIIWVNKHYLAGLCDENQCHFIDSLGKKPSFYGEKIEQFFSSNSNQYLHNPLQTKDEMVCGAWICYFCYYFVRISNFSSLKITKNIRNWWQKSYGRFLSIPPE